MKKLLTIAVLTIIVLTMKVNASTITPTSAKYMSLWCIDDTCDYTESGATTHSQWLNINTSYQNPAGHIPGYYLEQLKFRFELNSSNYLQVGNTYIVSVKFNLNPRIDNGLGTQYWGKVLDLAYVDNTTEQITGYSASCSIVNNDNYGMVCSFAIAPTKQVKTFTFRINLPFEVGSIWDGIEGVNFKQYAIMTASDTTEAINQQTNELIINSNQNTQEIINQLIEMQEKQKEENQVCELVTYPNDNKVLNSSGGVGDNNNFKISDFIKIEKTTIIKLLEKVNTGTSYLCFYDSNKVNISCLNNQDLNVGQTIEIPSNSYYFRATFNKTYNKPVWNICKNGNQAIIDNDHNYNNNPSDNTQEEEEELQESLWEMLDFDISDLEIGINPNASEYIWTIINQLRGINAKIIVLMTAILGLGIVKMILNR